MTSVPLSFNANPSVRGCCFDGPTRALTARARVFGKVLAACFLIGLPLIGMRGQTIQSAFVYKYENYIQTGTAPAVDHRSLQAGFAFKFPVTLNGFSAGSRVSGPGFSEIAYVTDETSGLVASTVASQWTDRSQFDRIYPDGTFTFSYQPKNFEGSVNLSGNRYPAPIQITNLAALQSIDGASATVRWAPRSDATPGDSIMLTATDFRGAIVSSSTMPLGVGVDSSASILIPSGQIANVIATATHPTARGAGRAGEPVEAGYRATTRFSIRSVSPPDTITPLLLACTPALDASGIDPKAIIELTFDKPMRPRGQLTGVLSTPPLKQRLEWSDDRRTVRIIFPDPLPAGPVDLRFGNESAFDGSGSAFWDISGNSIPAGSVAARFFVGNLPVFVSQPSSVNVRTGTLVTITSDVRAPQGPISYQWYRDGLQINGATNSALTLADFDPAQAGLYELLATNAFGATKSTPALVLSSDIAILKPAALITASNEARNFEPSGISPGIPVTLTLTRWQGAPTTTQQWRRNGQPISGATATSLTFASIKESDSGYYDALLTNRYGVGASSQVLLTVRADAKPDIVGVSRATYDCRVGTDATLHFGLPLFGFFREWQFEGKTLQLRSDDADLALKGISSKEAGIYRYYANNGKDRTLVGEYKIIVWDSTSAPYITQQPTKKNISETSGTLLGITAGGPGLLSFTWRKSGVDLPGATSTLLPIKGGAESAGNYTCLVSNQFGSTESESTIVTFVSENIPRPKPTIAPLQRNTHVTDDSLALDSSANFRYAADTKVEWKRDGILVAGADGPSLVFRRLRTSDSGSYTVVYTDQTGPIESDPTTLQVIDASHPPVIYSQRRSVEAIAGTPSFSLPVGVAVRDTARYRWFHNGRDVTAEHRVGADGWLQIASVQPYHAGLWSIEASNSAGTVAAPAIDLTVVSESSSAARLRNLSTRAYAGEGSATLIVGLNISGAAPKRMLLRGVGPGLRDFGVSSPATNPQLTIHRGSTLVAANDNWYQQTGVATLVEAQEAVGAFGLKLGQGDAALVATLPPGAYTLQFVNDNPSRGALGLIEAYDLDPGYPTSRLTNLSSRIVVGAGQQTAIPGLTVAGTGAKTYLIRAIGPGLAKFGVSDALADPRISLGGAIDPNFVNDNWEENPDPEAIRRVGDRVGAFALDAGSKDAALLLVLRPGSYTANISGAGNSSGVVLVEVYEVPDGEIK